MNVLFITLDDVKDINDHGIFKDLYREFVKNGHYVYIVSPTERRNGEKTRLIVNDNYLGLSLHKLLYYCMDHFSDRLKKFEKSINSARSVFHIFDFL